MSPLDVLVVEDNLETVEKIAGELRRVGFDASIHRPADLSAFLKALEHNLDLVVTDYVGNMLSAAQVLDHLRMRPLSVPVVIIGDHIGERAVAACIRQGAADYLPCDQIDQLGDVVRRALDTYMQSIGALKQTEETRQQVESAENEQRLMVEALRETAAAFASAPDREEVMKRLLSTIARIVPNDSARVLLIEGDMVEVVAQWHAGPIILAPALRQHFSLQTANFQEMLATGMPLVIPNTDQYPGWEQHAEIMWARSYSGAPIRTHGRVIGFVNVLSATRGAYGHEHGERLQAFADQVAIALENVYLYDEVRRYASELERRVDERTAELAIANERLKELDRLKSKFIADISHELRTPITSLNMGLFLMERDTVERRDKHLASMKVEMERLMNLTSSVLDLARMDLIQDNPVLDSIDLNLLIWQVIRIHRIHAEANNLQLIFDPEPELPLITADQNQIQQVVGNLLMNSVSYTLSGEIYIATQYDKSRNGAWVYVRDTGIGIEQQDLPHVFERFYRGRQVGQSNLPGTGLGLSIAKDIVTAHQGKIDIESVPGQGTSVRIWLPLSPPAAPAQTRS